jgi:hypothetical protein
MDKLRYSSWKLEFTHYPVDRWFWSVFLLCHLIWFATVIENVSLTCSRSEAGQGSCQILRRTLFQLQPRPIREFPIAALEKAEVEQKIISKCHRMYLRFNDGQAPYVLGCKADRTLLQAKTIQVNAFIATKTKPSLQIEGEVKSFRFFYITFSIQAGFILWLSVFSGQVLHTTFDKPSAVFTLRRLGLWKRKPISYALHEISRVELEFGRKGSYRLNVVLTSQQKIPLTTAARAFSERNRRNLQASCDRLNKFLNSLS